jgi:hypothetical protein
MSPKNDPPRRRRAGGAAWLAAVILLVSSAATVRDRARGLSRLALLFIDLDGLACAACWAALEELGRLLSPEIQTERVRGILTYRGRTAQGLDERRGRIVRIQWRGYAQARRLGFPVVFDDGHAFQDATAAGLAAFLFDFDAGTVKKIAGPVRSSHLGEIAAFLNSGR